MEPALRTFDQELLGDSDQIALYSKLIDIIDKDIENIHSNNVREGLNLWGILGSIAAGVVFFLNKTSNLNAIPEATTEVGCVSLIALYFGWMLYNVLSGNSTFLKPGRLMATNEFIKGRFVYLVLRVGILIILSYFLLQTNFTFWSRWVSVVLIFIPLVIFALSMTVMRFTKRPYGNNPDHRWSSIVMFGISFLCYLLPILLLGSQLTFPVGQELSNAYSLGIAFSAIIVLFEFLLSTASHSSNISAYLDLRDDLIIREISLNDALGRYRIIREGKSSWDELRPEFEKIISEIKHHTAIFDQQLEIIEKQRTATDSEFEQLSKSFMVYANTFNSLFKPFGEDVQAFQAKLGKTLEATGDRGTDLYIRNELESALVNVQSKQNDVSQANSAMFQERSARYQLDQKK